MPITVGQDTSKTRKTLRIDRTEIAYYSIPAAEAAGLVSVLKSDGPLTVFAPTDEAFAKLPAGTVESLLKPENKKTLAAILTYHVVPGKMMAGDVLKKKGLVTANGQRAGIAMKGGKPMIDNAAIVATDINASNGVVHVIDQVILPPAAKN